MADDIAQLVAFGLRHLVTPSRLGEQIQHGFYCGFGRRRQAIFDVFVTLPHDLQIGRQNQRAATDFFGAVDELLHEYTVTHHVKLKPQRATGTRCHVF